MALSSIFKHVYKPNLIQIHVRVGSFSWSSSKACLLQAKHMSGSLKINYYQESRGFINLATKSDFLIPIFLQLNLCRPYIFQSIYSVGSNNLSLKFQRFTPSVCKDIWIRKFGFLAKTQFL